MHFSYLLSIYILRFKRICEVIMMEIFENVKVLHDDDDDDHKGALTISLEFSLKTAKLNKQRFVMFHKN